MIQIEVNNQQTISIKAADENNGLYITKSDGETETSYTISEPDIIMMLNWYHYQKSNGNTTLNF